MVSTGTSYSSSDLSVEVTQHTFGRRSDAVTYYVADIYMADLRSFQAEFAGEKYDANGLRVLPGRDHGDIRPQSV